MDWFDTINTYYKAGFYTVTQIGIFVAKGKITANQYQQITGQTYAA